MLKVIVINNYRHYLGIVRLNQDNNLEIVESNQEDKQYLLELLKKIIEQGVQVFMSKQTGYGDMAYYQPVTKDEPAGYLEGVRDSFRGYGLTAYLLQPKQANLWRLMHQAGLPKEIRNKISYYMQDIPEELMEKLIKILEEKAEGYQEALQETVKEMEMKK